MTTRDFGNTVPAIHDTAPGEGSHPCAFSLSTRRITPMARPVDERPGKPAINKPYLAALVAYFAAYFGFIAWCLS